MLRVSKVSPSTISELNKKAHVHIEDWRNRPLQGGRVYADGICLRCNRGGEFENVAILVAIVFNLDCDDGIEYSACVFESSPEELVLRKERLEVLCHAPNSLSEKQGRRVEARILDGKKLKEVAEAEGVTLDSVSDSVLRGLANMRNYLKENW